MSKPKYRTKSDLVINKTLYFNGKKLSGVQRVEFDYDINKAVTVAKVHMVIKRGSLKISDDTISFDEVAYDSRKSR